MIKGVTHAHLGPILGPLFPKPGSWLYIYGWDFFRRFLQQTGSRLNYAC